MHNVQKSNFYFVIILLLLVEHSVRFERCVLAQAPFVSSGQRCCKRALKLCEGVTRLTPSAATADHAWRRCR
jgi:hypothetical protein